MHIENRSVPTDVVLPHIEYRSVTDACDWLGRVFGFQESYRYGDPTRGIMMRASRAYVMIRGAEPGYRSPTQLGYGTQMLTIFVDDVDAHYQNAKRAGATIVEELHETVYGERQYGVEDIDGHRWLFSRHARDVSPDEWGATIAAPRSATEAR
jgi:uncharacterized glyoxalase superfamily protein PhnB